MASRRRTCSALFLTAILMLGCPAPAVVHAAPDTSEAETTVSETFSDKSYSSYINEYKDASLVDSKIELKPENISGSENVELTDNYNERAGKAALTGAEGYTEYTFTAEAPGFYNLRMEYIPTKGNGSNIVRGILIDGAAPFNEAEEISFRRTWVNETKEFKRDSADNEVFPIQVESPRWASNYLFDAAGYYAEPLKFYLTAGEHRLRIVSVSEPMAIGDIEFSKSEEIPSYAEYIKSAKSKETPEDFTKVYQGEKASYKSDSQLYPSSDHTSAATEPSDPVKSRINVIGGENWNTSGQWISWDINVPQEGLYKICFKARQNVTSGAYSNRLLLVNGVQPFLEAGNIRFSYNMSWKVTTLQVGGEDAYIYLNKGKNDIRLQVSLGEISDVMQSVRECVVDLNVIYRRIMMVTGPNPDANRSYQFQKIMPDVMEMLEAQSKRLDEIYNRCLEITGEKAQVQIFQKLKNQTYQMYSQPRSIASRFGNFRSNITELGAWIFSTSQQPLEIDWIAVLSANEKEPPATVGIFKELFFAVRALIGSFFNDYQAVAPNESGGGNNITVWIGSGATGGRDQAQLLRQMIDNGFAVDKEINVNLQLVTMGSLMTATLANKGPDIALSLGGADPVNYAVRNAVLDLSEFPGFDEVSERFMPSAMAGLTFNGKTYGLPETQVFPMLFYRKDILDELNLQIPKTWDDVVTMLPNLQKKQMMFGLPLVIGADGLTSSDGFNLFLFQHGGTLYNQEGSATTLKSTASIDAFEQWTNFYLDYSLYVTYDFLTWFRSGQVPIGISNYSMYNTLTIFAPEIKGLWDFCDVPGVMSEDGTINNSVPGTVSASVIMSKSRNPEASWEFLKWWTSAEIQGLFGSELEAIMGPSARYTPANIEAMKYIPWTTSASRAISSQWKSVVGIPEIPGSYYTSRYIGFAFRDVVFAGEAPGEVMEDTVKIIDDEIAIKRKEFGLK